MRLQTVGMAGGDTVAIVGIAAALIGWLPPIAASIAIVWYAIQIYESQTLQNMFRTYRLRRLVRLRAEATALELLIREKNQDKLGELNRANRVHTAAIVARQAEDDIHPESQSPAT